MATPSDAPLTALPRLCGWTVQPELNRAVRDDREVRLEPRIMQVLACLLRADGQPVTRDELMQQVWGHEFVTEDALNRCISKLRRLLDEELACAATIDTLPKVGYRLRQEPDATLPASVAANDTAPAPARPPWGWVAGIGGAAIVGAALALWLGGNGQPADDGQGRVRPLTSLPGNEYWPELSPDSSHVAFAWRADPGRDYDIMVQPVNADTQARITDDPRHEVAPAWSPDGTTLAYLLIDKPTMLCEVRTVAAVGGPSRRVADCNLEEWSVTWTPDGTGLVFVPPGGKGLARLTLADGTLTPLTFPPTDSLVDGSPAFSPDGATLAFTRWRAPGVADVYLAPADGGAPRRITFDNLKVHGMAWAPDARHLVYSSNRGGAFGLWRVSVDGDAPRRVPIAGRSADDPTVSRDGRWLVYEETFGQTNLFSVDSALPQRPPVQVTLATRWDWNPAVSPDGTRLAFVSDRSGSAEVWVSGADGRDPLRLTGFDGPYTSSPTWSPDGTRIVFDSPAVEGNFDLWEVDAAGGAPRRLTTNPAEDRYATFAADGRSVYFASRRTGDWEIWRMDLASRVEQQVTRSGGYFPQVDARGEWLYFARNHEDGIFRQPVNDPSRVERVLEVPIALDCTNWRLVGDTLWLVVRDEQGPILSSHDLASGVTRERVRLPELFHKTGIAVDRGGRAFYASVIRSETDLVLMEYR